MTAEIAIMNLQAVALAADSAITTYPEGNQKVFSSANKLFALSDIAPVGILVYGNASFMSIPWETIVKEYRRNLGRKTFTYLHEYSTDFCRFIAEEIGSRISEQQQLDHAEGLAIRVFAEIRDEIQQRTKNKISQAVSGGEIKWDKVGQLEDAITVEVINEYHSRAKRVKLIEGTPRDFEKTMRNKLGKNLKTVRALVFRQQRLQRGLPKKINYIAIKAIGGLFDKVVGHPSGLASGIVVSGFGDRDIFPAISEVLVEGMIQNKIKMYPEKEEVVLDPDNRAMIVPFAQTDMVSQFMEGIAPNYLPYLHRSIVSHIGGYTNALLEILDECSDIDISRVRSVLDQYTPQLADHFVEDVKKFGAQCFSQQIMNVVAMLPKEQLAEIAESLVNLTALKRRVSSQEETVGGPTDVALITKGDGLIWIKHKHYFAPELNPSYFARTSYRRIRNEQNITRT